MLKSKSRVYFYILAPLFIFVSTGILQFVSKNYHGLRTLCAFIFFSYLAILAWRIWIDRPGQSSKSFPLEKTEGKIPKYIREIALNEYDYVRETMAQAMNDRHTMINYFLLASGVFIATIGLIMSQEGMSYFEPKNEVIISLAIVFNTVAWIHLLMIIRLRQAWCESTAAMNRIKQFFLLNNSISDTHPSSPFYWRSETTPKAARMGNLYHLAALLIGFVSSSSIALIGVVLLWKEHTTTQIIITLPFFIYHFLLQVSTYTVLLDEKNVTNVNGQHESKKKILLDESRNLRENKGALEHPPSSDSSSPQKVIVKEQMTEYDDTFKLYRAQLRYEKFDGTMTEEVRRLSFERGHSAAILLLDVIRNEFVFVEQFRYPAYSHDPDKGWLVEIIAGMVQEKEKPLEAIKRETIEEIGHTAENIKLLTEFYSSPGGSSEHISLFFGELGQETPPSGKRKDDEDIRVVKMPIADAYSKLEQGYFEDAKTMIALHAFKKHSGEKIH